MDGAKLKKVIENINKSGIKRFTLYFNNSYLVEVDSESTKCIFDDENQMLWYFRIPNMVQPKDFRPLALECTEYELIERVCVQSDYNHIMNYANNNGLKLTNELTNWIKASTSQSGLYPTQTSNVDVGENNPASYFPSIS